MSKGMKKFWIGLLLVMSVVLKVLLTYEKYTNGWIFALCAEVFGMSPHSIICGIDAIAVIVIFALLEKRLKHVVSKVILAVSELFGFMIVTTACRYLWQIIDWRGIVWVKATPLTIVQWAIVTCFEKGYPAYHWAVAGICIMCAAIIIFRRHKTAWAAKAKTCLMRAADKTKSGDLMLIYYDIILTFLKRFLTKREFNEIKVKYEDVSMRSAVRLQRSQLKSKFDRVGEIVDKEDES